MRKKIIPALMLLAALTSCKKDYQCQCTNSNGTYDAGDPVSARTKHQATKTCDSELSSGDTKCSAK